MRTLLVSAAVLACAGVYGAQRPQTIPVLAVSPTVAQQIVHLMRRGIHDQIEPAACVSQWRVRPDTIDIDALTVAQTDSADSLNIWWHRELCGNSQPSFHGHIWRGEIVSHPSSMDSITAANISHAPFHLLAFRITDTTFGLKVYGLKP